MSHCAMISVPKVLDIKWHESSYNRNKGVKKASRISKNNLTPSKKCDVTNKKDWLT